MAKSITLESSKYDGRYMKLVCEQTSNGGAKNTSTIKWTISTVGGNSSFYSTGPTNVIINGTTVYSKDRVAWSSENFPASKGSTSGEITVSHTSDGSKSIDVSFTTAIHTSTQSTYSDTWELDKIPRYGTSTQSLNSKTETTIKMNWESDSTVDYLWYSTDNGSNWTDVNVTDGKSGTYTITGLTPNTEYNIVTRLRRKDSQLWKNSTTLKVTTYDFPYCTSAPNFTIGDELTLTFYNPLGRKFNFYVIANGVQINDVWEFSGTTYKGVNSLNTQNLLYATIPNKTKAPYKIKTVWDDYTWTAGGNTMSIDESKCLPTFTNFSYSDTSDAQTKTGVVGGLIKNYSKLTVSISSAQKMVPKNGATASKYVISIDTKNTELKYSTTDTSVSLGTISNYGSLRLNVRAYDSRGLSTVAYKDILFYDYEKPIINASVLRRNNYESETTIKVEGTFSRVTMTNDTDANKVTKVSYWWREAGGSWSPEIPITTTITGNKYKCNDVVISLDNSKEFEVWIRTYDDLGYSDLSIPVSVGKAIFFISTNKGACYINGAKVPTFEDIYPVGSVYCNSTNTNPSSIYGGTWELIDKGFKNNSSYITQDATEYLSTFIVASIRTGQTVRFRIAVTTAKEIDDTSVVLGTIDLQAHGLRYDNESYFPYGIFGDVAMSDGGNTTITYDLNNDGALEVNDCLNINGTHVLPAGSNFYINAVVTVSPERMNDSFCDKFYWKRTS